MAQITIKETWLKLSEQPEQFFVQAGIRPYEHQVQTFKWLMDPRVDVIFNGALTGGGKSLAAFSRALFTHPPMPTLALYPTNELGRDQESQLKNYITQFHPPFPPRVCRISADLLAAAADTAGVTRQTELLTRFQESEIILTNPDIYHYVLNLYYLRGTDTRDKVFARLVNNFDLVVFDEFHLFGTPQVVSVINAIFLTRHISGPGRKKFLFLSATPSHLLREFLEKAGVNYQVVESEYGHLSREETKALDEGFRKKWRRTSHEVTLNLVVPENGAERWIMENAETVLVEFFRNHPGSKGAVILNSVAAAKRVARTLRERLGPQGITVGENTGFSTESEKLASYRADVLIGTSTVDVGVDFKINLLIFEAVDASSFIQRFGRLGRHDGYTNEEGSYIPFQTFCAYALVPRFIYERLFLSKEEQSDNTLLVEGSAYSREELRDIMSQVYPPVTDFRYYPSRWGVLQSAYIYYALGQKEIKGVYETIREGFKEDSEQAFGIKNLGAKVGEVHRYLHKEDNHEPEILEVARSFRGTSGLECGVIDLTVEDPKERFKTYDLPRLLSNWRIAGVLDREEFLEKAEAIGISKKPFDYASLFLEVNGFLDRPSRWRFYLDYDLGELNLSRVLVLKGFRVLNVESDYQNRLNTKLRQQRLVCYILEMDRFDVKFSRALPLLFPVYPLADQYSMNDPNPPFSVAFGQEALMLESLFFFVKSSSKGWII
ncbi:MAG: type I-D CRISPR-associated helicase Cas3' [Candidatus Hadarchaeum sp.]